MGIPSQLFPNSSLEYIEMFSRLVCRVKTLLLIFQIHSQFRARIRSEVEVVSFL